MTLDNLVPTRTAVIQYIPPDVPFCRRLRDLGFVRGSKIKALFVSPAGNATAYQISGSVIVLRKEDARGIVTETTPSVARTPLHGRGIVGG